jgi:hypothetical protein
MENGGTFSTPTLSRNHKEDSDVLRARQRDSHSAESVRAPQHPVVGLQKALGNRAVQRMLARHIQQPKLLTSTPDHLSQRDADPAAEKVTMAYTSLAVAGATGGSDDGRSSTNAASSHGLAHPELLHGTPIHTLQENLGNRSFSRLLQPTLGPEVPKLNRKCACGGNAKEESAECRKNRPARQGDPMGGSVGVASLSVERDVPVTPERPLDSLVRTIPRPSCGHTSNDARTSGRSALSRAEMVPGYYAAHAVPALGSRLPLSIQRDKIDYRVLTWDDFQGKAPKGATFDAETNSGLVDPDLKAVLPKVASTDTGESCKGGKATKFKADITIDPTGVPVKSFMWQEKSWKQDWLTDDAAARKHCEQQSSPKCEAAFDKAFTDIKTERSTQEKACTDQFDAAKKKAIEDCKNTEKDCMDSFDKGSTSYTLDPVTANSKKECTTKILPACVKAAMDGVTFEVTFTGGTATAKTRGECGKGFGEAFEKLAKDDAKVTMSNFDKSVSVTVSKRADCRGSFLDDCAKTLTPPNRDYILSHEQRHFDLTDAMAKKAQSDLTDLIKSFPKEVADCGKDATETKAKTTLADELSKLQKSYASSKKDWAAKQKQYDDETRHGQNVDKQKEWSATIDKGFLKTP